jgi:hypothetical protein
LKLLLLLTPVLMIAGAAAEVTPPDPSTGPDDSLSRFSLIYVSDYFSFVGADGQGPVAFALDNNRGRDGDTYQAEHFVVLHDEKKGWIDVLGNGSYENSKKELKTIPDSAFFQFTSSPETGLTITSPKNRIMLKIAPFSQRTLRTDGKSVVWMGTAPAVLTWDGRTIAGRVIYEYLSIPHFNRLTRTYWGLWKEFQGFYLLAGQDNDVYLHTQQSDWIAPLIGKLVGFSVFEEQTHSLSDLKVEVLDYAFTLGFYRWPTAWKISWGGDKGSATLSLTTKSRKKIGNWAVGGFAMSVISGSLTYDGTTWPIYGMAELIM